MRERAEVCVGGGRRRFAIILGMLFGYKRNTKYYAVDGTRAYVAYL